MCAFIRVLFEEGSLDGGGGRSSGHSGKGVIDSVES